MTATPTLKMITLDCPDPARQRSFWSELLGWDVAAMEDDYAMLTGPGASRWASARSPTTSRRAGPTSAAASSSTSTWPARTSRRPAARVTELGGSVPDEQPGETWTVALDPAGHPFCLTAAANW